MRAPSWIKLSVTRLLMLGLMVTAPSGMWAAANAPQAKPRSGVQRGTERYRMWLQNEVRHQLVMLVNYTVFDNLAFKIEGEKVILMGQVVRPTLKSDAEAVVKKIEGVRSVVNQIEVLPLSPNDDRIRLATYRSIFGTVGLERYALQAVPPIHIIVKNGNVTLEGVVDNEADKNLANIRARAVSGVFSVTNNLRVQK